MKYWRGFKMNIGISTGAIYKIQDINESLGIVSKTFDINCIEIALHNKPFYLKKNNILWLKSLKYVSFHPVFLSEKRLIDLNNMYHNISAKNITFHPDDLSHNALEILKDCNISIENIEGNENDKLLLEIMKKNKNLNFTLDISHAYTLSKTKTSELLKLFLKRTKQLHLSTTANNICHQQFKKGERSFFKSINILKEMDLPAFIETNCGLNVSLLKQEIKAWKGYFNG